MNSSPSTNPRILLLSGILWALSAILCWGAMFPVADALMEDDSLLPASIGMLRYLLAAPILFILGCSLQGTRAMLPSLRQALQLALLGLIGSATMALLLFIAQRTISPINASLLESYVPIQVLLLGLCSGHHASLRTLTSITLGFLGTLLVLNVITPHGLQLQSLQFGDLLIFLSGLCWAIYTAYGRPLAMRLGGLCFTTWTVLFGGLWLLLYHALCGTAPTLPAPTNLTAWCFILFLAVFPTGVAFYGWNQAQKSVPLTHLSFMEYFTPLVAAAASALLGRGTPTPFQWLGIAIVIASATLLPKK